MVIDIKDWLTFYLQVVEIAYRYDIECVPEPFRSNKLAYIENDFIPKNCTKLVKVTRSVIMSYIFLN